MVMNDTSDKSSAYAAGALGALAKQDAENSATIVKRLVLLVGMKVVQNKAVRLLHAVAAVCENESMNQLAMSKLGGLQPLIPWLENQSDDVQIQAARAVFAVASNNKTTQAQIGNLGGITSLMTLFVKGSLAAKENACSALWHLASLEENRAQIAEEKLTLNGRLGGVGPLVGMLTAEGERAPQLSAMVLLRLAEGNTKVAHAIAQAGAVRPLVKLLTGSNAETQQVAAATLAAIACVSKNRDRIANAGGIAPLIGAITSRIIGTPETAARALGWLARNDTPDEEGTPVALQQSAKVDGNGEADEQQEVADHVDEAESAAADDAENSPSSSPMLERSNTADITLEVVKGGEVRRAEIQEAGGIEMLISMLDGSNLFGHALEPNPLGGGWVALNVGISDCTECKAIFSGCLVDFGQRIGMQAQAASTLSALADGDSLMQQGIIGCAGVAPLLSLVRSGSQIAQEHAARAIWYLSSSAKNQVAVVDAGAISDLVALLRHGTPMAQYVSAAGLGELAYGSIKQHGHGTESNAAPAESVKLEVVDGMSIEEQLGTALGKNSMKLIDMFREWDTDGNGTVDKEEFFTAVTNLGYSAPRKAVDRLFKKLDVRGNGEIEFFDLTEALRPFKEQAAEDLKVEQELGRALGEQAAQLTEKLREWDSDGGGTLDRDEFYDAIKRLGHRTPRAAVYRLFVKLDQKGKGAIEFADLTEALQPYLQGDADTNADRSVSPPPPFEDDRLRAINEAGGIVPLVRLVESGNPEGKEKAAAAIWHLALDNNNQVALAACGAIKHLVSLLADGTTQAKRYSSQALTRLAMGNPDNQGQMAKRLVALLDNDDSSVVSLAAMDLQALAQDHEGAPIVIVNAGAISPLVAVLSNGKTDFGRQQAAKTLHTLANSGPANQQAIAIGLVALLGAGTDQAQEYVTQLLLTLTSGGVDDDPDAILLNRKAIAKAGPFKMLVMQLSCQSLKVRTLASAVLAQLSGDSEANVSEISASNGIPPLVALLAEPDAQQNATMVLADMCRISKAHSATVVKEGGLPPLLSLLSSSDSLEMKAFVADTLGSLVIDHAVMVGKQGATEPLVALLKTDSRHAQKEAAHALAGIANGGKENQDRVKNAGGVELLVKLLIKTPDTAKETIGGEDVQSAAASALAALANRNAANQTAITACGGIEPLIKLVTDSSMDQPKVDAARTLWSLSEDNFPNQTGIANANGISALVQLVRTSGEAGQESGSGAIASLAANNEQNLGAIAKMLIELLRESSSTSTTREKMARGIARFASASAANQDALALAGGIDLVVSQLDPHVYNIHGGIGAQSQSQVVEKSLDEGKHHLIQRELCSATWSMGNKNPANQKAIADAGGVQLLIAMLGDHPEIRREAAGALWSLAADANNRRLIAEGGGIPKLVELLKPTKTNNAQDTAAGTLESLAERSENRVLIADADGIELLIPLFEGGSPEAKKAVSGGLLWLAVGNIANQYSIVNKLVIMLANGPANAQEALNGDRADELRPKVEAQGEATNVIYEMSKVKVEGATYTDAMQRTQAITQMVRQLKGGTEETQKLAQKALSHIGKMSNKLMVQVTQQLVTLLGDKDEGVRQRAGSALRGNNASKGGEEIEVSKVEQKKAAMAVLSSGVAPLVELLRGSLIDNRVEAQEYSLRGLSNATDSTRCSQMVENGIIPWLIKAVQNKDLGEESKEHAAKVLASLALDKPYHDEIIK